MQSKVVFIGPTQRDGEAAGNEDSRVKTVKVEGLSSEGDLTYHTMIFGSTGKGKSVLLEKYRELGYEIIDVPIQPDTSWRKPKVTLPPVKVDEYLTLPGELFADAAGNVHDILGCYMTQAGVARFLSESRIGAQILWFNEVETQIRDDMYNALAEFLTGESSWIGRDADYETRMLLLRAAARARGYLDETDGSK
jgi:hypothetical protein